MSVAETIEMNGASVWNRYRHEENGDYVNRYIQFCKRILSNNYIAGHVELSTPNCVYPHLTLGTGAVISIRAGSRSFCHPQENNILMYEAVEVSPIFVPPENPLPVSWQQYASEPGKPVDETTYLYVPINEVNRYIKENGGFVIL